MKQFPGCRMYEDLAWTWPIISPPEDYEEEAGQFIEAIEAHAKIPVKTILDMGSGGGHNDVHLKKHYKVTGLDLSPRMIENARRLNPGVEYLEGDMRTTRFEKQFDAVLLADAVMYLLTEEDLLAAFQTAYHHLNQGGALCTYAEMTPDKFQENMTDISFRSRGGTRITLMENQRRTGPNTFRSTFLYMIEKDGRQYIEAEAHDLGMFSTGRWAALLGQAGFLVHVVEFDETIPMFVCVKEK